MEADVFSRIQIKFWGVRGSIPTPQLDYLGYGGNTTCIEIRLEDRIIIIDGGSGVRPFGNSLVEEFRGRNLDLTFLMTHFHWDHIQGLPFFAPLYVPENRIRFLSALEEKRLQEALEGQMTHPYFPVSFDRLAAAREFTRIDNTLRYGAVSIHAFPLHHPQGATGYRLEADGAVIVHASDFEHGDDRLDTVLRDYAQGADILIYDAQYTPQEYAQKKGWGHSTWVEASNVARDAGVKRLILFHHDPGHTDRLMLEILQNARTCFENTDAAQEGWSASL